MKYLSQLKNNLSGQTALLRIDLNVEEGQEKNSLRVKEAAGTIRFLLSKNAKILLLSHRGRPKGHDGKLGLRFFDKILEPLVGGKITFIGDFDFPEIGARLKAAEPGSIFLLENLRFLPGEEKNDPALAKNLAALGDFYVNDAFAVSHRANASVKAVTRFAPSYAGLNLEKEIKNLGQVMKKPARPLVFILGGAKVADKIKLIEYFLKKADYFLLGGGIGNTFIASIGLPIGESLFDPEALDFAKKMIKTGKMVKPIDLVIHEKKILDIGSGTVDLFSRHIKNAKTIVWNGPLGFIEEEKFSKGTVAIAKAVSQSKAFSIVGGGETTGLILRLGLEKKIGFLSTGGGAMLEYLSGKKLPGLTTLKK